MSHHDRSEKLGETPARPRRPRRSLAISLCLAVGLVFSVTGSALAISGVSSDGSAVLVQYPLNQEVQGTQAQSPTIGNTSGDPEDSGTEAATASGGEQAVRQVAAAGSGRDLPFTGSASLLMLGLGGGLLLVTGAVLRRRISRGDDLN